MDIILGIGLFIVNNAQELVGIALPLVVEFLNRDVHKEGERFVVTVVTCVVAAIALKWQELTYGSPEAVLTSASVIFLQSQAVFKLYFKDSNLRKLMQSKLSRKPEEKYSETDPNNPAVEEERAIIQQQAI